MIESVIDTVQDFLIKLGIKPRMHPLEILRHFFTISCHRQTYQNYELSRQKLGTILENKVHQKLKFQQMKNVPLNIYCLIFF